MQLVILIHDTEKELGFMHPYQLFYNSRVAKTADQSIFFCKKR